MVAEKVKRDGNEGCLEYRRGDGYFTVKMHHGGFFGKLPWKAYIEGSVNYWDYCQFDRFSLTELDKMVEELGYSGYMDYFWLYPGMPLDDGLIPLKDEADVMQMMMLCLPENPVIEIYIVIKSKAEMIKDELAFLGKIKEHISPKKAVIEEIVEEGDESCPQSRKKCATFVSKQKCESSQRKALTWVVEENEEQMLGRDVEKGNVNAKVNVAAENVEVEDEHEVGCENVEVNNEAEVNVAAENVEVEDEHEVGYKNVEVNNEAEDEEIERSDSTPVGSGNRADEGDDGDDSEATTEDVDYEPNSGTESCEIEFEESDNDIGQEDNDMADHIPGTRVESSKGKNSCMGYTYELESEEDLDFDDLQSIYSDSDEGDRYPSFNERSDISDPKFLLGQKFTSFDVLRKAIRTYGIKSRCGVRVVKSEKRRLRAKCAEGCPWTLYATPVEGGMVQIKTYIGDHSCIKVFKSKHTKFGWIAQTYLENVRSDPDISITALRDQINRDFNLDVPRTKVWRGIKKALQIIRGDEKIQFAKLADYGGELRRTNPGTMFKLRLDNLVFQRVFICLEACKEGFLAGCRPIIGVDGCFLKGHYGGQLLAAVGLDANDCIFPIAYARVEVESFDSWHWFLSLLGEKLGIAEANSRDWTITSDRQKGLLPAVHELFPEAEHRFCVRHLYNNFKSVHPGGVLKELVWSAATSTYVAEFNMYMERIKVVDENAWKWLTSVPPKHWSRAHFREYCKCDILLNNICECFNRFILDARDKPILTMLEIVRTKLMVRIANRRKAIESYTGVVCPRIVKKLNKSMEHSGWCIPVGSGGSQCQVSTRNGQFVVDLANHTCSCRKWQLSGIPCAHACSAIGSNRARIEDYVHSCYKKETCARIYEHVINPITSMEQWQDEHHNPIKPPELGKIKRGRKQKKRRKEEGERENASKMQRFGMKMHCSVCREEGHTKRTCKRGEGTKVAGTKGERRKKLQTRRNTSSQPAETSNTGVTQEENDTRAQSQPIGQSTGSENVLPSMRQTRGRPRKEAAAKGMGSSA